MHAVVHCSPPGDGRTHINNSIPTGGQESSLVLIKGLQRRVVARVVELEPEFEEKHSKVTQKSAVCLSRSTYLTSEKSNSRQPNKNVTKIIQNEI